MAYPSGTYFDVTINKTSPGCTPIVLSVTSEAGPVTHTQTPFPTMLRISAGSMKHIQNIRFTNFGFLTTDKDGDLELELQRLGPTGDSDITTLASINAPVTVSSDLPWNATFDMAVNSADSLILTRMAVAAPITTLPTDANAVYQNVNASTSINMAEESTFRLLANMPTPTTVAAACTRRFAFIEIFRRYAPPPGTVNVVA